MAPRTGLLSLANQDDSWEFSCLCPYKPSIVFTFLCVSVVGFFGSRKSVPGWLGMMLCSGGEGGPKQKGEQVPIL